MKKAEFNKRGTRQLVDTGWKAFDRQTNCIAAGNVIANTQLSLYVRPYRETECNGHTFKPGELLEADLKAFRYRPPDDVMEILRDEGREKSVILYMFSTSEVVGNIVGRYMRVPFLWVVTTADHRLVKCRSVHRCGAQMCKRYNATREILRYITEEKK
jgi:hypothetical protein